MGVSIQRMRFKLLEEVELSEKGPPGQGKLWKEPFSRKYSDVNVDNYSLHHINSIHTDNSQYNLAVIPSKLHSDITREINKRCREYLINNGIIQSISLDVWRDTMGSSKLDYDPEKNLFFIPNQVTLNYSIPSEEQLDLFGEM